MTIVLTPIDQGMLFLVAGGLGVALSRVAGSARYLSAVSFLNIWIALPGIFFVIYLTRGALAEDAGIVVFSSVFTLLMLGLLAVATRRMTSEVRGSVILNGTFVNAINLPFPLLQFLMGTYSYAATFAATTSVIQIVAAKILQGHFGTGSGGGAGASLKRAAPLIAAGAGVVSHYLIWPTTTPGMVVEDASVIQNVFIAMIFVHFGLTLGKSFSASNSRYKLASRPFLTTALFRTLIGPLLAMALAIPLGEGSGVYLQMVFEATMPPAIINTVLAGIYGFDADFTAKSTTILTPINTAEAIALFYVLRGFW
jgi:predicted permease